MLLTQSTARTEEIAPAASAVGDSGPPVAPVSSAASSDDDVRTVAVGTIDILEFEFTPAPNPTVGNKTIVERLPTFCDVTGNRPARIRTAAHKNQQRHEGQSELQLIPRVETHGDTSFADDRIIRL